MRARILTLVLATAIGGAGPARAAPAKAAPAGANKFKLKPGASGTVCLECHTTDIETQLKKPFVHTPVKSRDCIGCHNPHAAQHGKLLAEEPGKICASCHQDVVPAKAKSTHKPVSDGCVTCHEPHASDFPSNLVKAQVALCAGCHKEIAEGAAKAKVKHRPVEQGCATCHDPHGSATGTALLKGDVPGLCVKCHKTDRPTFLTKHAGYPVSGARCTSCHDPHGSDTRGMLYNTVHPPVARGLCSQCHEAASSPNRFRTKQAGINLCKTCHAQRVLQMMDQSRLHWATIEGAACLNCHNPHASKVKGLVKSNLVNVCGKCHADTVKRQERSPTKHKPITDGQCQKCHDPHGSPQALMLKGADRIDLCGTCHDWQKHSTHPIGAKFKDPRNPNLTLECLSCHRAHGTEYKHMMPYATTTDMCTKCHQNLK